MLLQDSPPSAGHGSRAARGAAGERPVPSSPPGVAPRSEGLAPAVGEGWRTCPAWGRGAGPAGPRLSARPRGDRASLSPPTPFRDPAGVQRVSPAGSRAWQLWSSSPWVARGPPLPAAGRKGTVGERAGMFPSYSGACVPWSELLCFHCACLVASRQKMRLLYGAPSATLLAARSTRGQLLSSLFSQSSILIIF